MRIKLWMVVIILAAATLWTPGAKAAEVQLGAAFMYDWWSPVFKDLHTGRANTLPSFDMSYDYDGSFMMGPTLTADKLSGGWGVRLTPLFGVSRNAFSYTSFNIDMVFWDVVFNNRLINTYFTLSDSKARRYDVDLAAHKELHKNILLLIGARFNYGDGDGRRFMFLHQFGANWFNLGRDEFSVWNLGPSLGLGFRHEIKDFSFGINASFLVCVGVNDLERRVLFPAYWAYLIPYDYHTVMLGFGVDSNVWIAYFIKKAHLSVNLGFRWVGTFYASLDGDGSVLDLNHKKGWAASKADHFYGITFGVAYRF